MQCPCGSSKEYAVCCEPFLNGDAHAPTAEALMRSRYSAFVKGNIKYIRESLAPETRKDWDEASAKEWADVAEWKGLQIHSTKKGGPEDTRGTVEFTATYRLEGKGIELHEVAEFRKIEGKWFYVDGDAHTHEEGKGHHHGHHHAQEPIVRAEPKVGRNDACPCGSGKKFKKCHGAA